jgi:hypothetical protein
MLTFNITFIFKGMHVHSFKRQAFEKEKRRLTFLIPELLFPWALEFTP